MADKYRLMRCRECGLPRFVNHFIRWNDNGTITQYLRKDFRVVMQHYSFINGLFSRIGSKIGISLDHIAFEAQRNSSKAVFEALYDKIPGMRFASRFRFGKRSTVAQFNKVAAVTGMGYSETLEYVPGKYGVARLRNPFDFNLMAANVVGAFEVLEGVPFKHTWEDEGNGSYVIRVEATGDKPEISERMALEYPQMLPGNRKHERCGRCHAPLALGNLKWVENDGIILDKLSGDRIVMLDGYMIGTVFREMAMELGDDLNDILVDSKCEWVTDHAEQLGMGKSESPLSGEAREETYREQLDFLPIYGQGNPVALEISGSALKVIIENPYEPFILAGSVKGIYELVEGREGRVSWERVREGVVAYTVDPA